MSHGFDQFLRQYYKAENISTWSNDTINTLRQRSECITKQYDQYKDTQLNRKVFCSIQCIKSEKIIFIFVRSVVYGHSEKILLILMDWKKPTLYVLYSFFFSLKPIYFYRRIRNGLNWTRRVTRNFQV
jgi:hypothetical protein